MTATRPRRFVALMFAGAISCFAGGAFSEPDPAEATPNGPRGEDLTISVLTFGPGDHPFYKFGHDAIWIHDASAGEDAVYNYGMFSFDEPSVLLKFFAGRFRYWLGREGIETLEEYREDNRSILAQELDLSAAEKVDIQRRLDRNARPENRAYKYDYYQDNCATRVRDLIDEVTHGHLRAASAGPGRLTFRGHTLRLTWDSPAENLILDWLLGPSVDRPITRYEELFLPGELAEALRRTRVVGADGGEHALVKAERIINDPHRERLPDVAPSWIAWTAATGIALGGALLALGRRAASSRASRIGLGLLLATVGLVFGFFGSVFVVGWALTDHEVAYRNENLLLSPPWAIALVVIGVALARGSKWAPRAAWLVVAASALTATFALVSKALPWFSQNNGRFIALALPLWIGAASGLYLYRRSTRAPA